MCPRSEPSSSSTAQPRPLVWSPSSLPSQVNSAPGRPSVLVAAAVHPSVHGDEAEAAGTVLTELDMGGSHQVQGVGVPEVRRRDPPLTDEPHPAPPWSLSGRLPARH